MFNAIVKAVMRKRSAYRALFAPGPARDIVLADLSKFCRATSTPAVVSLVTQQIDPVATGVAIGRLEVWHRISQNLHIDDADLYKLMNQDQDNGD
jgi:hypothetical protein